MALMPEELKFTPEEQAELDRIQAAAKVRHEMARKAAAAAGRRYFPLLPRECSWAYEEEFRRGLPRFRS